MIKKVEEIADNPLKAAHDEEERMMMEELATKELCEHTQELVEKQSEKKKVKDEGPMETALLQSTLSKVGALLALGFGEAGSKIIA